MLTRFRVDSADGESRRYAIADNAPSDADADAFVDDRPTCMLYLIVACVTLLLCTFELAGTAWIVVTGVNATVAAAVAGAKVDTGAGVGCADAAAAVDAAAAAAAAPANLVRRRSCLTSSNLNDSGDGERATWVEGRAETEEGGVEEEDKGREEEEEDDVDGREESNDDCVDDANDAAHL